MPSLSYHKLPLVSALWWKILHHSCLTLYVCSFFKLGRPEEKAGNKYKLLTHSAMSTPSIAGATKSVKHSDTLIHWYTARLRKNPHTWKSLHLLIWHYRHMSTSFLLTSRRRFYFRPSESSLNADTCIDMCIYLPWSTVPDKACFAFGTIIALHCSGRVIKTWHLFPNQFGNGYY